MVDGKGASLHHMGWPVLGGDAATGATYWENGGLASVRNVGPVLSPLTN